MIQPVCPAEENFNLAFSIPPGSRPRMLRWDPFESQTGRVRIDAIELTNTVGETRSVDLRDVESNGRRSRDGTVSFPVADPMFWWPVGGELCRVVIRGWWESDDSLKTAMTQSRYTHELAAELAETQRQLRNVLDSPYWRVTAPLRAVRNAARIRRVG